MDYYLWISMDSLQIYEYQRASIDIHRYPWTSMHGYPWTSMDIPSYPWILSMDIPGYSWIALDSLGLFPWTSLVFLILIDSSSPF